MFQVSRIETRVHLLEPTPEKLSLHLAITFSILCDIDTSSPLIGKYKDVNLFSGLHSDKKIPPITFLHYVKSCPRHVVPLRPTTVMPL
uniref:Uncharacterized protein n=1 Tax=Manihot esculenta TaxID=3983 RepID=A0A2C9U7N0_MANES